MDKNSGFTPPCGEASSFFSAAAFLRNAREEAAKLQQQKLKEEQIMEVTYRPRAAGAEEAEVQTYTGELWKLERLPGRVEGKVLCNFTILCPDGAYVSFEKAPLDTLRFSGGCVVFGKR